MPRAYGRNSTDGDTSRASRIDSEVGIYRTESGMNDDVYKDFKAFCEVFQRSPSVSNQQTKPSLRGPPFDADKLRGLIKGKVTSMPKHYRPYGTQLVDTIGDVSEGLERAYYKSVWEGESDAWARGYATLRADTAVGAVVDWGQEELKPCLQGFAAVASDLFRSFARKEAQIQRMDPKLNLKLNTEVPPLVTFAPTPGWGPSTLTSEALRELGGPAYSVVSLPLSYRDDPIMWGILAHEVCGHDTVHAVDGLIEELKEQIRNSSLAAGWPNLWEDWAEEAVADVFGVLNIGPYYALGLAAWLSASAALDTESPIPLGQLRNRLNITGGRVSDEHPVDLLRLHLAIGAVEGLGEDTSVTGKETGLDKATIDAWVKKLEVIAASAAGGVSTIDVCQDGRSIVLRYPLDVLAREARTVGRHIVTVKLKLLRDRSIQQLETWSVEDERRVNEIIENEDFSPRKGDDEDSAHLIAAAFGVLLKDKTKYDLVTNRLRDALRETYRNDPLLKTGGSAPRP
jgi:hypothetical protein